MSKFAKYGIGAIVAFVVLIGLLMMADEIISAGDDAGGDVDAINESLERLEETKK